MVRQHHERLDGSGYPQGLKGEAILPEARILAVADVVNSELPLERRGLTLLGLVLPRARRKCRHQSLGGRLAHARPVQHALGLAMANLGDIDAQTLAGALCTGTHGTGARLGGLATQVEALELVLADGSVGACSASGRPELFAALAPMAVHPDRQRSGLGSALVRAGLRILLHLRPHVVGQVGDLRQTELLALIDIRTARQGEHQQRRGARPALHPSCGDFDEAGQSVAVRSCGHVVAAGLRDAGF